MKITFNNEKQNVYQKAIRFVRCDLFDNIV